MDVPGPLHHQIEKTMETTSTTETLHFTTTGVTCGGCVNSIRNILGRLPGVVHVDVDVQAATANVEIQRGSVDAATLNKAVAPAGYAFIPR